MENDFVVITPLFHYFHVMCNFVHITNNNQDFFKRRHKLEGLT